MTLGGCFGAVVGVFVLVVLGSADGGCFWVWVGVLGLSVVGSWLWWFRVFSRFEWFLVVWDCVGGVFGWVIRLRLVWLFSVCFVLGWFGMLVCELAARLVGFC